VSFANIIIDEYNFLERIKLTIKIINGISGANARKSWREELDSASFQQFLQKSQENVFVKITSSNFK
jgi:hypothetical protein